MWDPAWTWIGCLIAVILAQQVAFSESLNLKNESAIRAESAKMVFQLFTRKNPMVFHQFELYDLEDLQFSPFDVSKPVKVLIHGWRGHSTSAIFILIKNAYLIEHDVNVITVSWDIMSNKNYWSARNYVPKVGQVAGLMIQDLIRIFHLNPNQIHIIGHSLGGHVAGVTGNLLTNAGLQIGRITGLDPAGPLFFSRTKNRIKKTSAAFVDIIHTSKILEGYSGSLGHVDFYPNGGGPLQPMTSLDITSIKSHRRAYWLFAESIITPGGFQATACRSWSDFKNGKCSGNNVTEMGEHVSRSARGMYFLTTNGVTPFAKGPLSLKYDEN